MTKTALHITLGTLALTGCAAPAAQPTAPATLARAGQVSVTVDGADYAVSATHGAAGQSLTRAGGVATYGLTMVIQRTATPLGMDEGKAAKAAAAAGCSAQGGTFNTAAIGHVRSPGAWEFEGACA